jgi:DNA-directed RNA polymerase
VKYGHHLVSASKIAKGQRPAKGRPKKSLKAATEETAESGDGEDGAVFRVDEDLSARDLPPMIKDAPVDAEIEIAESTHPAPRGYVRIADVLPPVPARGDFDLTRVRESTYFFRYVE